MTVALTVKKCYTTPEEARNIALHYSILSKVSPIIKEVHDNRIIYEHIRGRTLYEFCSSNLIHKFVSWGVNDLWNKIPASDTLYEKIMHKSIALYITRTLSTIDDILKYRNVSFYVVRKKIKQLACRIEKLDLGFVLPATIHGDLHPSNIIYCQEGDTFKIIDVDSKFFGIPGYGDMCYDLAKFNTHLLMPYEKVRCHEFTISQSGKKIITKIRIKKDLAISFAEAVKKSNIDYRTIKFISGIIIFQRAMMHAKPINEFMLFHSLNLIDAYI